MKLWFNTQFRAIKQLEKDDLDLANAGQWPTSIKAFSLLLLIGCIVFTSHGLLINNYQNVLTLAQKKQLNLLEDYRYASFQAENLSTYQQQMRTMEDAFMHLLAFLPNDNEIPSLLDNIQQQANQQHLDIIALNLKKPKSQEFYTQLAFEIKIRGEFHHLIHFMAGISSLDRIVTLHNFSLKPDKTERIASNSKPLLILEIEAQTYRYNNTPNNTSNNIIRST